MNEFPYSNDDWLQSSDKIGGGKYIISFIYLNQFYSTLFGQQKEPIYD